MATNNKKPKAAKGRGKQHPVHADSLLRLAKKYEALAEYWQATDTDPQLSKVLHVVYSTSAGFLKAEGRRVQKIKR